MHQQHSPLLAPLDDYLDLDPCLPHPDRAPPPANHLLSPLHPSFFFTPNSPRHFRLELDSEQAVHASGNSRTTATAFPSISRKIDFSEEDDLSPDPDPSQDLSQEGFYSDDESPEVRQCPTHKSPRDRSGKYSKGLRNLTKSVYRIVSELERTRYKEVADQLSEEVTRESGQAEGIKQTTNIKRRVYDALNVLIAVGLLRKEGKLVICNEPYSLSQARNLYQAASKRQAGELQQKTEALRLKQEQLRKLEVKRKSLGQVIARNQGNRVEEGQKLQFPLIGMVMREGWTSIQAGKEKVLVRTGERPRLYGDVDLMVLIGQSCPERLPGSLPAEDSP